MFLFDVFIYKFQQAIDVGFEHLGKFSKQNVVLLNLNPLVKYGFGVVRSVRYMFLSLFARTVLGWKWKEGNIRV